MCAQQAVTGGAMSSTLPWQAKVLMVAIWFLQQVVHLLRLSLSFEGHIAHSVRGIFFLNNFHFIV